MAVLDKDQIRTGDICAATRSAHQHDAVSTRAGEQDVEIAWPSVAEAVELDADSDDGTGHIGHGQGRGKWIGRSVGVNSCRDCEWAGGRGLKHHHAGKGNRH